MKKKASKTNLENLFFSDEFDFSADVGKISKCILWLGCFFAAFFWVLDFNIR